MGGIDILVSNAGTNPAMGAMLDVKYDQIKFIQFSYSSGAKKITFVLKY